MVAARSWWTAADIQLGSKTCFAWTLSDAASVGILS
jgi:hypothetical protein